MSDSHLGAGYIADRKSHEMRLCHWLDSISPDCEELYLLGDVIDYWFEYKTVAPRGYVRFLGRLAALADRGVKVVWLRGNHDLWMADYLSTELGIEVRDGIVDVRLKGKRFVMEHGDGVGRLPKAYALMRRVFRNGTARKLYAAIHPRITMAFAQSWSSHSRKAGGYAHIDPAPLIEWANDYAASKGEVDFFVVGHLHMAFQERIKCGAMFTVLGECFTQMSYAAFDGENLRLLTM